MYFTVLGISLGTGVTFQFICITLLDVVIYFYDLSLFVLQNVL